ncbi:adenylosuccinate synthase [Candidatus Woesearchaeota archaeon]|nr:adenylosuccinate synthase [Candidatus Woesearchaeota archaeon]
MNRVVIGAYWGDEGKGKIVDLLASDSDWVVRFNGGDNAGHTILVNGRKVVLHILPSGVLQGKNAAIGPDVFFNPKSFFADIKEVESKGFRLAGRVVVDDRAHVIMPYHIALDMSHENSGRRIGTTGKGIGPVAKDKASRREDITIHDLLFDIGKIREVVAAKENELVRNGIICQGEADDYAESLVREYSSYASLLKPFVGNVMYILNNALATGQSILVEAAQGTLLDIVHGTRPFVTSSNTTSGGAFANLGLNPKLFRIIGIVKAYPTRVGEGLFPTEMDDEFGKQVQMDGFEFGATTGRVRRIGMPDFVALSYSAAVNGVDEWVVTKLDVLAGKEFTAAVSYEKDGQVSSEFPSRLDGWKPVYNGRTYYFDKFSEDQAMAMVEMGFDALPDGIKDFLKDLVMHTRVPVSMVSLGPERGVTVIKNVLERTKGWLDGPR